MHPALSINREHGDGSALPRASDTVVSMQLDEAVALVPRSADHRHYQ
jgi:hypothetical protein